MGKLIDTVVEVLEENDWQFQRVEDKDVIMSNVRADNASFTIAFDEKAKEDVLLFYIFVDGNIAEERRIEVAEFITRANYGLKLGNFELDMDDGEVRYKISIDVEGSELSSDMVRNMLGIGISTIDRYYPSLMSVSFGNAVPSIAVAEVEEGEAPEESGGSSIH